MLIIRNGDKNGDRTLELGWHDGERCPPIPMNWKSIEVYADGDERHSLLARLSLRFQSGFIVPPEAAPAKPIDPAALYDLFREVRRWREEKTITAEAYAYFLDRWALLCVQLRAGQ